jgi:hypothetical protein
MLTSISSKRFSLDNTWRLFQFLLVAFSLLSMLLGFSVIHAGVNASIIPVNNNPGIQQCGGGSCPVPTQTAGGGGGCNPDNWYYYGAQYEVKILSADSDKPAYHPGEPVTITGTVELIHQDYWQNECGELGAQSPVEDNAGQVQMGLTGQFGGDITNDGGSFTGKVNVPADAEAGQVTYTVTASYSSASDSMEVSFKVTEFSPILTVVMDHGSFVYPSGEFTVSGSDWAPNGIVTLDYLSLGTQASVTVGPSGTFTAPSITVPSDAAEDSYNLIGKEAPNLEAFGSVTVQWRNLIITETFSPPSVQQGDTASISGTVTDNEGKPVAGVTVTFAAVGLPPPASTTTGPSGGFSTDITVPSDAVATSHAITAMAEKTPGYRHATAERSLEVSERPPLPDLTGTVVATAGAAAGLGAGYVVMTVTTEEEHWGTSTENTNLDGSEIDPDPCQPAEKTFQDLSKKEQAIWDALQTLRNNLNAVDIGYGNAVQSGYNWALFTVLTTAASTFLTSLLGAAAASEGSIPTVSSTFERVRNVAQENLEWWHAKAELLHKADLAHGAYEGGKPMFDLAEMRERIQVL